MIADATRAFALVCALVPILVCVAAGSAVGRGRLRWPGADMLVGFGVLSIALTFFAVTMRVPLSWAMAGLAILSVIGALLRQQLPGGTSTWLALVLISPVLFIAAGHTPAMWDDFWNWVPSAVYEYRHNSLPWPDLPPSFSIFPGYPKSMPLMSAAAYFVSGRFLEVAGPVINVALLAGSSALFAEALAATLVRHGRMQATAMPPVLVAVALVVTIHLNPGLRGEVVLSSYADCGTMVAVGALALLGVEILARLSDAGGRADVKGLAWRFGFVGALLVNLKQANPVLLALVVAGLILVALRDPSMRTRRALLQLPRMLGPAIFIMAIWRWYVTLNLIDGEKSFQPFADWNFDALHDMFVAVGGYMIHAPLFYAVMWPVTAAGVVFFFQAPRKAAEARWLAVVCATVWLGYNAFLFIIYLGVMSGTEAGMAADYWRYMPHVALIGLYAPAMALATARVPAWVKPRRVAVTLAMAVLAVCILPLRSDLNDPVGREWQHFLRNASVEMRRMIPPESKVLIVPYWNSLPFSVAVRYNLWRPGVAEKSIVATVLWNSDELAKVASWAARGEVDYLIVQDAKGSMDDKTDILGLPRLNHELVLFVWRDGKWQPAKSWPIPPALIERKS
jgi:hypothetical protein